MGNLLNKLNHIVYIEGNIGAGKTELLNNLEKHGYTVVREAIADEWSLFEKYKEDPKRWCASFQHQVCVSITKNIEAALSNHRAFGRWPIFVERSILTAYLFASVAHDNKQLSTEELNVLRDVSRLLHQRFDGYYASTLYLSCSTKTCLERIKKRARPGEDTIDENYLLQLERAHTKAMESNWITVDAEASPNIVASHVMLQVT